MRHAVVLVFTFALILASCSEGSDSDPASEEGTSGTATGAVCADSSALTYESFGSGFMTMYCTRCHSAALSGPARSKAPLGHDFDTLAGVLAMAEHIDTNAAGGPRAVNRTMPPSGSMPTDEERRQLGAWIACEVAKQGDAGSR